jgi:phospholipid/cholesterol/gamma-HCH transport system substrate-binding protein
MNRNMIETVLGAVVLLTAAVFLGFAYNSADMGKTGDGYMVSAEFDRIDGLKAGSDVRINGVLVGSVKSVELNKETYRATAKFNVASGIKLSTDTNAQIASESLLGGKYLSLELGVDDEMIPTDGKGKVTHTTPPMRLDDLIGQLIYNKPSGSSAKAAPAPVSGASPSSITPPASSEPALPVVPATPPKP